MSRARIILAPAGTGACPTCGGLIVEIRQRLNVETVARCEVGHVFYDPIIETSVWAQSPARAVRTAHDPTHGSPDGQ